MCVDSGTLYWSHGIKTSHQIFLKYPSSLQDLYSCLFVHFINIYKFFTVLHQCHFIYCIMFGNYHVCLCHQILLSTLYPGWLVKECVQGRYQYYTEWLLLFALFFIKHNLISDQFLTGLTGKPLTILKDIRQFLSCFCQISLWTGKLIMILYDLFTWELSTSDRRRQTCWLTFMHQGWLLSFILLHVEQNEKDLGRNCINNYVCGWQKILIVLIYAYI